MDLSLEFDKLEHLQHSLLACFHSISPFVSNEDKRLSIINDSYKFQEILRFIENELSFQFNYPSEVTEGIEDIFLFDKYSEFFLNFKKNFGDLQFRLRDGIKQSFQQSKEAKYKIHKSAERTTEEIKKEEENSNKSINEKVLSTNKRITSKLQESSSILQSSLLQSQLNLDDLTIQDQTLSELSDKYTSLKGILNKSDEFVKNIKLSNARDKQRMYYSLIFFGLCCVRVVWSRLLKFPYRIVKYLLWLVFWTLGLMRSKESGDLIITEGSVTAGESILQHTPTATIEDLIQIVEKQDHQPVIEEIKQENEKYPETAPESVKTFESETQIYSDDYDEQLSRIIDEL